MPRRRSIQESFLLEKQRRRLTEQNGDDFNQQFIQENWLNLPSSVDEEVQLATAGFAREFMKKRLSKNLQNSAIPSHPLMDQNLLMNIWDMVPTETTVFQEAELYKIFESIHPNLLKKEPFDYDVCIREFQYSQFYGFLQDLFRNTDTEIIEDVPLDITQAINDIKRLAAMNFEYYWYDYPHLINENVILNRYEIRDRILDLLDWFADNPYSVDFNRIVEIHIQRLNEIRTINGYPLIPFDFDLLSFGFVLYDTERMVHMYTEALDYFLSTGVIRKHIRY